MTRKRREYVPSVKRIAAMLEEWKTEKTNNKLGLAHLADSAIEHWESELKRRTVPPPP